MYGYLTSSGYKGLVGGRWMLFATDTEYYEYMREHEEESASAFWGLWAWATPSASTPK